MKVTWLSIRRSCETVVHRASCLGFLILGWHSYAQTPASSEKCDYKSVFGDRYTEAVMYFAQQPWISDSIAARGIPPGFAKAIVFPEVIRYSAIRDKLEMQGLITLYVQYGVKYSNFSVGRFQMKPSFALQVEKDARLLPEYQQNVLLGIDTSDTQQARLARIQRLDSPEWQVLYLITFIKIMDLRYGHAFGSDDPEKLRFYAAAYNCGYSNNERFIRQKMNENHFHTALFRGEVCYNYGDIATQYYLLSL